MSVRAYRVKKICFDTSDTFNLWHDKKLVEFLGIAFRLSNEDLSGLVDISIVKLEEAIEKKDELGLDEFVINKIKKDIEIAKKNGDEYVTYYCF